MLLYKVAEQNQPKKKKKTQVADSLIGGIAPALAHGAVTYGGGRLTGNIGENISRKEAENLFKAVSGGKSFKEAGISLFQFEDFHGMNSHYHPIFKTIYTSKEVAPGILAHEMGHATSPFVNNTTGMMLYGASKGLSGMMPFVGGYRVGKAINEGKSKEEIDKIKTQDNIAAAVASAPMIAEESRANFKALQALKATNRLNAKNILPLVVSEASYLGMPLLTPASHKVVEFLHRKELDKQNQK